MPLPELQTQGIDLTNTLMKIKQLETNDLQQAHLKKQNALLDLQSSPAMIRLKQAKVKAELDKQRLEQQKAQVEQEKAILEAIQGHISAIQPDLEDYRKAKKWLTENPNLKVRPDLLPEEDVFLQEDISSPTGKKFNKDAFAGWQKMVTRSAKDLQTEPGKGMEFGTVHLPDGRAVKVPIIKGQVYDPEAEGFPAGSSMEAPKEKKEPVETWGKEEVLPTGERKQVSSRGKTKYEAPLKKEAEDKTLVPVQQADGTVVYTKRSEAAGKPAPSKKNVRAEVKQIVKNEAGETVVILKDGTPKVYGFDNEGAVALVDPKPEQLKGITGLPRPMGEGEAALIEAIKPADKKKEKPAEAKKYQRYATSAKGQTIGWTGTAWEDVKTGKVIE